MRIPYMRLDRQFANHRNEIMAAVEAVFEHGRVLQGPEVAHFEHEAAQITGRDHAVAVASATDALYMTLLAAGVQPGDRVAVPSFTFIASGSAIIRAGAFPVFVDIGDAYQPDTESLIRLVQSGTISGVLAVHLFGQMANLEKLCREANRAGVFVIEDAAQALGATHNGIHPGGLSLAACLSFDPTKIIGAHGSGGMVVTDSTDVAERIRSLRYHGKSTDGLFHEIGFNSQLPTAQAALLSVKLKFLHEWIDRRIVIAERYSSVLDEIELLETPKTLHGNRHVFHKYVVRLPERRDEFAAYLRKAGIDTAIHYDVPLHKQPNFSAFVEKHLYLPLVETTSGEVLSFPIYPELTDEEIDYICDQIRFFNW